MVGSSLGCSLVAVCSVLTLLRGPVAASAAVNQVSVDIAGIITEDDAKGIVLQKAMSPNVPQSRRIVRDVSALNSFGSSSFGGSESDARANPHMATPAALVETQVEAPDSYEGHSGATSLHGSAGAPGEPSSMGVHDMSGVASNFQLSVYILSSTAILICAVSGLFTFRLTINEQSAKPRKTAAEKLTAEGEDQGTD